MGDTNDSNQKKDTLLVSVAFLTWTIDTVELKIPACHSVFSHLLTPG